MRIAECGLRLREPSGSERIRNATQLKLILFDLIPLPTAWRKYSPLLSGQLLNLQDMQSLAWFPSGERYRLRTSPLALRFEDRPSALRLND